MNVYVGMCTSPNATIPLPGGLPLLKLLRRLPRRLFGVYPVVGFRRFPYEKRLRRLGLHYLNRHRLRGDLKVTQNVFSGGLDLDASWA